MATSKGLGMVSYPMLPVYDLVEQPNPNLQEIL